MALTQCSKCREALKIPASAEDSPLRCPACFQAFRLAAEPPAASGLRKYVDKGMSLVGGKVLAALEAGALALLAAFGVMMWPVGRPVEPEEPPARVVAAGPRTAAPLGTQLAGASGEPTPAGQDVAPAPARSVPDTEPADFVAAAPAVEVVQQVIVLHAREAQCHGEKILYEANPKKKNIGFWVNAADWVSWDFEVSTPGEFEVEVLYSCENGSEGSTYEVAVGEQKLQGTVKATGKGWEKYVAEKLGAIRIGGAGAAVLSVRAIHKPRMAVMNIRSITLRPAEGSPQEGADAATP